EAVLGSDGGGETWAKMIGGGGSGRWT
ncbi:hypothetical protein Tco_0515899, partial [Tanacetum coccineum]